jgi:DNA-binding NarL/FixJ family response regulator/class 3 adenylate cyclase
VAGTTTVVFTDVVASSDLLGLLGDDEAAAAMAAHLSLVGKVVASHRGRVAKTLGDGVMALFDSVIQAVRASVAVQQAVERVGRTGGGPALAVRVGINVGDLVGDGDDAFSAAVVVARRLCDAARPGHILAADVARLLFGTRGDVVFGPAASMDLKGVSGDTVVVEVTWAPLPDEPRVRVVVADDAALIRAGLVRLLAEADFEVIADVADADALLAAVERDPPDLVVTDIRMPPNNTDDGLVAAATIRGHHPATAVMVLSQHIEAGAAGQLLDGHSAGVGYLLKERVSDVDDFVAACRLVLTGGSVIDPIVSERLLRRRRHDAVLQRLTDREREVLGLMAQGKSNSAISATLFLSPKTIESHVRSIFTKLDLPEANDGHRRVQAVVRWLETTH